MANKAQKFELFFVTYKSGPLNRQQALFFSYMNKKHKQIGTGRGEPLQSKEMDESVPYQQFGLPENASSKTLAAYRKLVS